MSQLLNKYLSPPPTRQDLTQGLFYSGGFGEGGDQAPAKTSTLLDYVHRLTESNVSQMTLQELRLTKCNVSPVRMPAHRLNQTRRPKCHTVLSMILRPSKSGPARAWGRSVSNLLLTLIHHPARMPDGPAKKPGVYRN